MGYMLVEGEGGAVLATPPEITLFVGFVFYSCPCAKVIHSYRALTRIYTVNISYFYIKCVVMPLIFGYAVKKQRKFKV